MLNKLAFANSLTTIVTLSYVIFYALRFVAPDAFVFLFNAQFLGADVASLLPQEFSMAEFLVTGLLIVVFTWVMVYLWAWLYNRLAKRTLHNL